MRLALRVVRTLFLVEGFLLAPGLPWLAGDSRHGWLALSATELYLFAVGLLALTAGWAMLAGYNWAWKTALAAALANLPGFPVFTLFGASAAALLIAPGARGLLDNRAGSPAGLDPGRGLAWGAWPVAIAACWLGADWVHRFAVTSQLPVIGPVWSLLALWFGVAACWYAHELGHRVAGRSMGMQRLQEGAGTGSAWSTQVVPRGADDIPGRLFLYYLGGPLASLVIAAGAFALLVSSPGRPWAPAGEVIGLLGVASLAGFLASILPWCAAGQFSDGANLLQLLEAGTRARRLVALTRLRRESVRGLRPREWSPELLRLAATGRDRSRDYGEACGLNYLHCLDQGYLSSAESWMRQLVDTFSRDKLALAPEWRAEVAYFLAYHSRSAASREAAQWRDAAAHSRNCRKLPLLRADAALSLNARDLSSTMALVHLAESLLLRAPLAARTDFERELWLDMRIRAESSGEIVMMQQPDAPATQPVNLAKVIELPAMFDPTPQASLE